jgi:hypothetical protein
MSRDATALLQVWGPAARRAPHRQVLIKLSSLLRLRYIVLMLLLIEYTGTYYETLPQKSWTLVF